MEEKSKIEQQITNKEKSARSPNQKQLDRLAWLLEGASMCTAVSVIDNKLYVSANELFKNTEVNQYLTLIDQVMKYFQNISKGSINNEIDRKKHRDELIRIICKKQITTLTTGGIDISDIILNKIISTDNLLLIKNNTLPNFENIYNDKELMRLDHNLVALGFGAIIFRRFKKLESALDEARSEEITEITQEQLEAIQSFSYEHSDREASSILFDEQEQGVHAELQILSKIIKMIETNVIKIPNEIYIGISKKSCRNCHIMLDVANEVLQKNDINIKIKFGGAHNKPFEGNWIMPNIFKIGDEKNLGTRNEKKQRINIGALLLSEQIEEAYKNKLNELKEPCFSAMSKNLKYKDPGKIYIEIKNNEIKYTTAYMQNIATINQEEFKKDIPKNFNSLFKSNQLQEDVLNIVLERNHFPVLEEKYNPPSGKYQMTYSPSSSEYSLNLDDKVANYKQDLEVELAVYKKHGDDEHKTAKMLTLGIELCQITVFQQLFDENIRKIIKKDKQKTRFANILQEINKTKKIPIQGKILTEFLTNENFVPPEIATCFASLNPNKMQPEEEIVPTLETIITQLNEKQFSLFWKVYHNAELLGKAIIKNPYKYAYWYVKNFKFDGGTITQGNEQGYNITHNDYQLIDIEINAIGSQLLSKYKHIVNFIGSTGQGIGIGINNMLPETLEFSRPVIGIYNPGNGNFGHWIVFSIVLNKEQSSYTIYLKDSYGQDIDTYPYLQSEIQEKYKTLKQEPPIYHSVKEQKDGTSCGIFALNNAGIMANWLSNDMKEDFNNLVFTKQEDISGLRETYSQIYQKHEELCQNESVFFQNLANVLTQKLIEQPKYTNIVEELKNKLSNYIIKTETFNEEGKPEIFSPVIAKNTIYLGISFGENRNLIDKHQYNISIECSNDITNVKDQIQKFLIEQNLTSQNLAIDQEIFIDALNSLKINNILVGLEPQIVEKGLSSNNMEILREGNQKIYKKEIEKNVSKEEKMQIDAPEVPAFKEKASLKKAEPLSKSFIGKKKSIKSKFESPSEQKTQKKSTRHKEHKHSEKKQSMLHSYSAHSKKQTKLSKKYDPSDSSQSSNERERSRNQSSSESSGGEKDLSKHSKPQKRQKFD